MELTPELLIEAPIGPFMQNPALSDLQNSTEAIPRMSTLAAPSQYPGHDSGTFEEADPGSLDDKWPENNDDSTYEQWLKAIFEATLLDNLRAAIQFIKALQSASLDDKYNNMNSKWLHWLRNPLNQSFNIENSPDLCLSLNTFLVSIKLSVDTYANMQDAILQ